MNRFFTQMAAALLLAIPAGGYTVFDPVVRRNERGNELFEQAAFDSALSQYKGAQIEMPDLPLLHFNSGRTFYQMANFAEAAREFGLAAKTDDPDLRADALANLGNAQFKAKQLKEAVETYKQALDTRDDDDATKQNLKLALSMLKQEKQEKDQQDQDDKQEKDQQDQDDKQEKDKQEKDQQDQDDKQEKDQQDQDDKQEKDQQDQDEKQEQDEEQKRDEQQQDQESGASQDQQSQGEAQPQDGELSQEEAQRILDALKERELEAQKQFRYRQLKGESDGKEW
jgi:hypothetical protein